MRIDGLQKMTLLDYPGHIACTVFSAGCNFRCPFCHNAPLVTRIDPSPLMTGEELIGFLKKRKGLLDGVCFTGGEPLLQDGIGELMAEIKALGFLVKLDTNGSFPARLRELAGAGLLDYVAMDIKNRREKYALTAGVGAGWIPAVEESMAFLLGGFVDYEFRTTVTAELHTAEDLASVGEWIRGAKRYFLQPFLDSGDLVGSRTLHAPDEQTLSAMLEAVRPNVPSVALRGV